MREKPVPCNWLLVGGLLLKISAINLTPECHDGERIFPVHPPMKTPHPMIHVATVIALIVAVISTIVG